MKTFVLLFCLSVTLGKYFSCLVQFYLGYFVTISGPPRFCCANCILNEKRLFTYGVCFESKRLSSKESLLLFKVAAFLYQLLSSMFTVNARHYVYHSTPRYVLSECSDDRWLRYQRRLLTLQVFLLCSLFASLQLCVPCVEY